MLHSKYVIRHPPGSGVRACGNCVRHISHPLMCSTRIPTNMLGRHLHVSVNAVLPRLVGGSVHFIAAARTTTVGVCKASKNVMHLPLSCFSGLVDCGAGAGLT